MIPIAAGSLDPQGPVAKTMADLWWFMLWLGLAVFVVFAALLAVALFRRRSNDDDANQPRRARRWMVWGGVVIPTILLVAVFAATLYAMLDMPSRVPDDALEVEIVGRQWRYEVHYPDEGISATNELHIPVGRPIALRLRSVDVIHSFWVPALAGKMDMMPDYTNTLILQADKTGEHRARCAEFCGLHHTTMELRVVVESPEEFAAWVAAGGE